MRSSRELLTLSHKLRLYVHLYIYINRCEIRYINVVFFFHHLLVALLLRQRIVVGGIPYHKDLGLSLLNTHLQSLRI
nr:MAG TPA: hypothetical protein [Caudoviricetes sp.]